MSKTEKKTIVWVGILAKNKDGKFLFFKRGANNSWGVGCWQLPGGKMEWGENPMDTLEREIAEETDGCKLVKPKFLGMHTSQIKVSDIQYHILQLVYSGGLRGKIKISGDHDEQRWMAPKEVAKQKFAPADLKKFITEKIS